MFNSCTDKHFNLSIWNLAEAFSFRSFPTVRLTRAAATDMQSQGKRRGVNGRSTHAWEAFSTPRGVFSEQNQRGAAELRNLRRLEFPIALTVRVESLGSGAVPLRYLRYSKWMAGWCVYAQSVAPIGGRGAAAQGLEWAVRR